MQWLSSVVEGADLPPEVEEAQAEVVALTQSWENQTLKARLCAGPAGTHKSRVCQDCDASYREPLDSDVVSSAVAASGKGTHTHTHTHTDCEPCGCEEENANETEQEPVQKEDIAKKNGTGQKSNSGKKAREKALQ